MSSVTTHNSFGLISLSKHSTNKYFNLLGSNIKHETAIELTINLAEVLKDNFHTRYFPREKLISIYLSTTQFTNLLTTINSTGTPCTITFTKELGNIESLEIKSIKNEINDSINDSKKKLLESIKKIKKDLDSDLSGTVNKIKKENIKHNIIGLCNEIEHNIDYLFDIQLKKLEKTGSEIIAETESIISNIIQNTGIENLKNQIKLIE
jgi:hypothetical protein